MKRLVSAYLLIPVILSFLFAACAKDAEMPTENGRNNLTSLDKNAINTLEENSTQNHWTVVATGLNQPRGLKFDLFGMLYIPESGFGGTISTVGECEQVPPPVGPYLGGNNGSITRLNWFGQQTRIAYNYPSTRTAAGSGGNNSSITSIAFHRGEMYALLSGAGCSHGHPEIPNGIVRVNRNGSYKVIADVSAFLKSHPVAQPEADDFEPDGDLYSMITLDHSLYFIESNHGELDRYDFNTGEITRVIDISATQGHIVPTALAYRNGYFYVGNLTTIPFPVGAAKILKISRDGSSISTYAGGFTTVLGLTFDILGNLYVLESSIGNGQPPFFAANSGMIVRLKHNNAAERTEMATGLNFPTAMTMGPDGHLYVSVNGYNAAPGTGQVVRVRTWSPFHLTPGAANSDVANQ